MSLRIKQFQFLTSVMDLVRYSTRFIFKKKENSANLNSEKRLLQNLKKHTPEKNTEINEKRKASQSSQNTQRSLTAWKIRIHFLSRMV